MIKNYFEQINTREQVLVGLTTLIVVFYVFYLFIFGPITTAQSEARKQLIEKKETLAWMQQVKHYANKSSKESINDKSQLLSLLTQQLSNSNLRSFPYQLQQNSSGNIQLSYDKVPFNAFVQWLLSFQDNYAISIDRLSATKLEQEGMVKLTIVFKP